MPPRPFSVSHFLNNPFFINLCLFFSKLGSFCDIWAENQMEMQVIKFFSFCCNYEALEHHSNSYFYFINKTCWNVLSYRSTFSLQNLTVNWQTVLSPTSINGTYVFAVFHNLIHTQKSQKNKNKKYIEMPPFRIGMYNKFQLRVKWNYMFRCYKSF